MMSPHGRGQSRAQCPFNAPAPITTDSLFHDGEYLTGEQMNGSKFLKLVSK